MVTETRSSLNSVLFGSFCLSNPGHDSLPLMFRYPTRISIIQKEKGVYETKKQRLATAANLIISVLHRNYV